MTLGYTNFSACAERYTPFNESLQQQYGWRGSVWIIPKNSSTQVSAAGCKALCGNGTSYYEWSESSATITTWVLPIAGVLLQAPFVSNAFWETIFSLARWIGNPIASLTYVLWNIKVSGKCALIADMAGPYEERHITRDSNFASMRNSLYLLASLNQYSIAPAVLGANRHDSKPAESLLRVALFSKDLRLLKRQRVDYELEHEQPVGPDHDFDQQLQAFDFDGNDSRLEPRNELNAIRQRLANHMRETRRKGVVPVFISTLWFLFALAISVQASFGYLGQNTVAHDLALGLLLSWLPVLILGTIVDRNTVAHDDLRKKLNRWIDHVRKSVVNDQIRDNFINTIHDVAKRADIRHRIQDLSEQATVIEGVHFFEKFVGQGRLRWHDGAAHPILCDIEDAFIAAEGRYWLRDEVRARTYLVLGKRTGGLDWLDYRELLQVTAAFLIVASTTFEAWILSFFTPTVGLGCRSGGYTVFMVIAVFLTLAEIWLWWYWGAKKQELKAFGRRATLNPYFVSNTE